MRERGRRDAEAPAGEPTEPLLSAEEVRTRFHTSRGVVRAVDGVSLTVERGKTLGLVGESGSGKTVLARSIMGLVHGSNVERSGRVIYEGREISALPRGELLHVWGPEMSVVLQDPTSSLNPVRRIGAQVAEPLREHLGLSRKGALARAEELLRSVGIAEPARRLREYPHQLSGGMRQRVSIAAALACEPKLLFADEPTTALDVTVQAQILDLLRGQQQQRNMAMVLVSHDLGVVAGYTDEVAVMYAGRVVERAPTRALFANMRMPYTEALLRSIPRLSDSSHTKLEAIPGRPPSLTGEQKGCSFAARCRYAQDKCREEMPPLTAPDNPVHQFRCWFPVGTPAATATAPAAVAAGSTITAEG